MFSKKLHTAGFTLIEVLVAMSILTVAFLGFYRLSIFSIIQINSADQKLMALNYATEGIEIVRNIRDNNLKANLNSGWEQFANLVQRDDSVLKIEKRPDGSFDIVPIDGAENLENWEVIIPYDSDEENEGKLEWKFYRRISVEDGPTDFEDNLKKITVEVAYEQRGIEDSIELSTYLGNIALIR